MRYPTPSPVVSQPGFSEQMIEDLMEVMSIRDGVKYTSYTLLRFSRPAVCLKTDKGDQKTITADNARSIMREERHGEC
jgi:hypothetical protein